MVGRGGGVDDFAEAKGVTRTPQEVTCRAPPPRLLLLPLTAVVVSVLKSTSCFAHNHPPSILTEET
jgi:hypothetical protein